MRAAFSRNGCKSVEPLIKPPVIHRHTGFRRDAESRSLNQRFLVIVGVVLATLSAGPARAQQLQRLHVQQLSLSTATARPSVDVPFDVTLTIRVAENLSNMQNVYLPTFFGPEELGDVRQLVHSRAGTAYKETLRLVSHARGPVAIGSAYMDAVDARDGRPKRFISNTLKLDVQGGPALDAWRPLRRLWLGLAAIAVLVLIAFLGFRRGRPAFENSAVAHDNPMTARAPEVVPSVQAALAELEGRPDRERVLALRKALWRNLGAHDGATLADVLHGAAARENGAQELLVVVERAAFIDAPRFSDAVKDVLTQRARNAS